MVMLLTVSLTPRPMDNNEIKIKKRMPLLISRLQHWVIRVNGLPFSKKKNRSCPPCNNPRQVRLDKLGKMASGRGGGDPGK